MKRFRLAFLTAFSFVLTITFIGKSSAATFTVTNTNDNGVGSLRQAIIDANSIPGDDVINFQSGLTGTITLTSSELLINSNITINGPGANRLIINRSDSILCRIFRVQSGTVNLSGMTLTGGRPNDDFIGGGIRNEGTLTLTDMVVSGNHGEFGGGGISSSGTLNIINSTISGNISARSAGGISSSGILNITRSTISDNIAQNKGGGIEIANGSATILDSSIIKNCACGSNATSDGGGGIYGAANITNSTISGNLTTASGGGFRGSGTLINVTIANNQEGIFSDGSLIIANSIVSANSGTNINGAYTSGGNNLINTNPLLTPLGLYGGSTMTHALLSNSPAINGGNNNPGTPLTDQRGAARMSDVDIGAFEVNNLYIAVLPNGRIRELYNQTLVPDTNGMNYTSVNALPSGLNFTANSSVAISGVPTTPGTYSSIFIIAHNSNNSTSSIRYSLTIDCGFSLSSASQSFTAAGGTGSIMLSNPAGCAWTASSNAPTWITITGGASGNGNGTVSFNVAPNSGGVRTGTITIGDQTFTVNQATGCSYSLTASSVNVSAGGLGEGSFSINTGAGCTWFALTNDSWITITEGGPTNGNGAVRFSVAANTGTTRTGTISIADQIFTVNQAGCSYSLSSTTQNFPSQGSYGSVNVNAGNGCLWTAQSDVSWITLNGGTQGSGNGTVDFTVAPNNGIARTGTITVAGQTLTIIQATSCIYSLSSNSVNIGAEGGQSSFNISTGGSECSWQATTNDSWITLNTSNGTGNGTIQFSIAANTGAARAGTITAEGQTFTINQASGIKLQTTLFDFEGDGRADISVFRPESGAWYRTNSSNNSFFGTSFGQQDDLITPADFDGDGRADIAVFRPSNGFWYRFNSSNNQFVAVQFGQSGDVPMPGDFDGDGRADISVWRPSSGNWFRLNSSNGEFVAVQFGTSGDKPQMADIDGDGKSDPTVYRPSNGIWYSLRSSNNTLFGINCGISTDIPTAADYDGDGKTDISVFRPSNGSWYRFNSSNNQFVALQFGANGDIPSAADYDGDGRADLSVFRPSNGSWYQQRSTSGFFAQQFGANGDLPIPSAFGQ